MARENFFLNSNRHDSEEVYEFYQKGNLERNPVTSLDLDTYTAPFPLVFGNYVWGCRRRMVGLW